VFFMLSGFLIAYVILRPARKNATIEFGRFYLRRFFRIAPTLYFCLVVHMIYGALNTKLPNSMRTIMWGSCKEMWFSNLLFINNFYYGNSGTPYDLTCINWTWTVAVEVQYYIFTPFFVWVYLKRPRLGFFFILLLAITSLVVTILIFVFYIGSDTPDSYYFATVYVKPYCRMLPYLIGLAICLRHDMLAQEVQQQSAIRDLVAAQTEDFQPHAHTAVTIITPKSKDKSAQESFPPLLPSFNAPLNDTSVVIGILFVIAFLLLMMTRQTVDKFFAAMGYRYMFTIAVGSIMWLCVNGYTGIWYKILSWKPLVPIARLSYSGYLFQFLAMSWLANAMGAPTTYFHYLFVSIVNLLVTNALALPIYLFVEKPFMNLRF